MTTEEHKVRLHLEQNTKIPVLDYFDPMVFLKYSPVYVSDQLITEVCEWYVERIRHFTLIDTYFLFCLSNEAVVKNVALTRVFDKKEVSKKLKLFFNLYNVTEFELMSGVDYFEKYPYGRANYVK